MKSIHSVFSDVTNHLAIGIPVCIAFSIFLSVLFCLPCSSANSGLPKMMIPDSVGVNIHFTGREDKQVSQISAGGFRWIRMDFAWSAIEKTPGKYDFKAYDDLTASLSERGIRPLFILDYSNPLYDNNKPPTSREAIAAFAKFAGSAAAHFKGKGVLWEIWNEPNLGGFWPPQPNATDYATLAKATYAQIKKNDSKSTVLGPALSSFDYIYLENAFRSGMLDAVDAVSLHAYGSPKPEDSLHYFNTVRGLIRKYAKPGKQYPVVSGEWGYSAIKGFTVEQQGNYIARCFINNLMNGIPLSIWYDWHDDGPDPNENEHHFGTVYQDYSEKPAYKAVRTLCTELKGYSYAGRIDQDSKEDYLVLFSNGKNVSLAAWTTGSEHTVSIPVDFYNASVTSVFGDKTSIKSVNRQITIKLRGGIQYIKPSVKSKGWYLQTQISTKAETFMNMGKLFAKFTAIIPKSLGQYKMQVSCDGLSSPSYKTSLQKDKYYLVATSAYTASNTPRQAKITLQSRDITVVQKQILDQSAAPGITVLPPSNSELIFKITSNSPTANGFIGRISVANMAGISAKNTDIPFEMPRGSHECYVRLKLSQQPAGEFSLSLCLNSQSGDIILRTPKQRFMVIQTFTDGSIGSPITGYNAFLDGDNKISASASLVYAYAPAGGPNNICAKLDYRTEAGWRFFRISPTSALPINGKPVSVRIWMAGDDRGDLARLRFTDSEGETFQSDYGILSNSAWNVYEANLDGINVGHWGEKPNGIVDYPIHWDTPVLIDTVNTKREGTVYIGPLMLVYSD